ncbi:MAG TPA: OmpA family protein [Candidatus Acidoferrales bacterium]|nr:OmpA family protein [Candidatus Acidoferrales bacterium]
MIRRLGMGLMLVAAVLLLTQTRPVRADEGVIGGVDLGAAVPDGKFHDRVHTGGEVSPFVGYMFNRFLGVVGQAQFDGFPEKNRPGIRDADSTLMLGFHAGPRVAFPFHIGDVQLEPYGSAQGGVATGLNPDSPIQATSWMYTAGGGLNVRLNDDWLVGAFGRYNRVDQEAAPNRDVDFTTFGLSLVYNEAAPEAPAPVAQATPAPTPAPAPPTKKKIVLRGVNFDFDKSNIRPDARVVLDEAVSTLKSEGGIAVVAEGHTDSKGSDEYNQKLSERRAKAVRDYLVDGGISANRIQTEGFGESRPVATNETADGRAQNRRVELRIVQ